MQTNWTKIINVAINKHFDSAKGSNMLYIEGQKTVNGVNSWAELRINGPEFLEQTKDQWTVQLTVDIMCNTKLGSNIYLIYDLVGLLQAAMNDIAITLKTGLILCLKRQSEIRTIPWGVVKKDVDVYCCSIMCDYKGDFVWQ